jgi:hypothetical protein
MSYLFSIFNYLLELFNIQLSSIHMGPYTDGPYNRDF